MSDDARICASLPTHPKTKKLIRRLGQASAWNLICLILWTASNRTNGDLSGMTAEDIELSADWLGEENAFVRTLVEVGFLDGEDGAYKLHDWDKHNPWVAGFEKRSAKARWNAAKRHYGIAEADKLVPEYATIRNATSKPDSKATSKPDSKNSDAGDLLLADDQQADSTAPSPSPSPSPFPFTEAIEVAKATSLSPDGDLPDEAAVIQLPIPAGQDPPEKPRRQKDSIPDCPYEALIALYHEEMPDNPEVLKITDARKRLMRERWRQAATLRIAPFPNGYTTVEEGLACWRKFFQGCNRSDFLTGKVPPTPPRTLFFFADIEFLFNAKRFINILEGKYHREAA